MKYYEACSECGATDYIQTFQGKVLCEKCLFYYDVEPDYEDDEIEDFDGSKYDH